jgi:hypothetical protein
MKELYKKLAALKTEVGAISKDSKNPFFNSKYFDVNALLAEVEPLLQKHELLLLQPISGGVVASLIIDPDTEAKVSSEIELPHIADPQKLGSAITYYRRYTLQSLLGLQAEDDDANAATKAKPTKKGPSPLEIAVAEIESCNTIADLQTIWNENKGYQKVFSFQQAKDKRKKELS